MTVLPLPTCGHCGEPLEKKEANMHAECVVWWLVGGVNHQRRLCSCFLPTGYLPPDPPSLSRREASRVAAVHHRRACGIVAPVNVS